MGRVVEVRMGMVWRGGNDLAKCVEEKEQILWIAEAVDSFSIWIVGPRRGWPGQG